MNEWKLLTEEILEQNKFVTFVKRHYQMPDESKRDYYLAKYKSGSLVFALDKNKNVIAIREFRPGPGRWLLDLPGGAMDDGDDSMQTAKRELLEETGYRAGEMIFLGKYYIDAYMAGVNYAYLALDCEKDENYDLLESGVIEVELLPIEEFQKHMKSGEMIALSTALLAIDYLKNKNLL